MPKLKAPSKAPAKKLKAGKKRLVNKWIVLAGVAAVAIIGVVVVRYSSASSAPFVRTCSHGGLFGGNGKVMKNGTVCSIAIRYLGPPAVTQGIPGISLQDSRRVCALPTTAAPGTVILLELYRDGGYQQATFVPVNNGEPICMTLIKRRGTDGTVRVTATRGSATINQVWGER